MEDEDINIDDEWISEFNDEERKYGKFYKEPNTYVSLQMIYVNSKKEIEHVTQLKHQLDNENLLTSTTLNKLILERKCVNKTYFRLYKLLLYNTSMEPEEIISDSSKPLQELREITEIMDIMLEDTINYLKPLNMLYFIFVEDTTEIITIKQEPQSTTFSLNKGSRRRKRHM
jgi:uncharacterized membrane protein (UPF0127 family)